jgi:hypothetical protein
MRDERRDAPMAVLHAEIRGDVNPRLKHVSRLRTTVLVPGTIVLVLSRPKTYNCSQTLQLYWYSNRGDFRMLHARFLRSAILLVVAVLSTVLQYSTTLSSVLP